MSSASFRHLWSSKQYRRAGERLGLGVRPSPDEMLVVRGWIELAGEVDGVALSYTRESYQEGLRSEADPPTFRTLSHVPFALPLDLGLRARSTPLDAAPRALTGDPEFDRRITVDCVEPGRVRALFTPACRQVLLALESLRELELDDAGLRLSRRADDDDEEAVIRHLTALAAWGRAAREALALVPVAAELTEHVSTFRDCASRFGLGLASCPLAVWGALPGVRFVLRNAAGAGAPGVVLSGVLEPAGAPLRVVTRTRMHALKDLLTTDDFRTGDSGFDGVLHAASRDPEQARAALTPGVRAALLALFHSAGSADVRDGVLNPAGHAFAHARLPAVLDALAALGRAHLGLDASQAPYR